MCNGYLTHDSYGSYVPGSALMSANSLLGNDVCNNDNEDLGDIREIMIDKDSGKVAYAMLSFGGMLGMGDKLFAVPWSALTLDHETKRFRLNASLETLRNAADFDKDHWPSMADASRTRGVNEARGAVHSPG